MEEEICPEHSVPTIELSSLSDTEETLSAGDLVEDRYRIERLLGRGAMGTVYLATQLSMDRPVAIKTLLRSLLSDYKLVQRFYRESRAASKLDHPNIIRTYDFGIDRTTKAPFIVMEYLEGQELSDHLRERGALPEREACKLLAQVAGALAEAHAKGVVHRDLKPSNIWLRPLADGALQAKVLDFGIAKVLEAGEGEDKLTGTGMTLGTPAYMSPEQIVGGYLDARSDLYGLGCILHELLTGHYPFAGAQRRQLFFMTVNTPCPALPETLANGDAPSAGMRALHEALLKKERILRPATSKVVAQILGALALGEPIGVEQALQLALEETEAASMESMDATDAFELQPDGRADVTEVAGEALPQLPRRLSPPELAALATGPAFPSQLPVKTSAPTDAAPIRQDLAPRSMWPVVAAAVVVLLGGVAATVLSNSTPSEDAPAPLVLTQDAPAPTQPSPAGKSPGPVQSPTAGPAQTPPKDPLPGIVNKTGVPAPARVMRVVLSSTPVGARVFEGTTDLGTTPLPVAFSPGTIERVIQLRQVGFLTREIVLNRDEGAKTVQLTRPAAAASVPNGKPSTQGRKTSLRPRNTRATGADYKQEVW